MSDTPAKKGYLAPQTQTVALNLANVHFIEGEKMTVTMMTTLIERETIVLRVFAGIEQTVLSQPHPEPVSYLCEVKHRRPRTGMYTERFYVWHRGGVIRDNESIYTEVQNFLIHIERF